LAESAFSNREWIIARKRGSVAVLAKQFNFGLGKRQHSAESKSPDWLA
jgi:hypothetical protein